VAAEVFGSVYEGEQFPHMLDEVEKNMAEITGKAELLKRKTMLTDTGYCSEDNLQTAKAKKVEAIIPDPQFRMRISPLCLTPTDRIPGGVAVISFWMFAMFSYGNEFNILAEPGFFVPALQRPFILRVIVAQKRTAWMDWKNCVTKRMRGEAILTFLIFLIGDMDIKI
jgi:hypothetical protein